MQKGRLQVDQICEGSRHLVEAGFRDPAVGLGLDNGDGCIGGGDLREQLVTMLKERFCDARIQRSTSPSAYHLAGEVRAADALEEHSLARDLGEACRQGYVFAG